MRAWLALVACAVAVVGASGAGLALAQGRPAARRAGAAAAGWSRPADTGYGDDKPAGGSGRRAFGYGLGHHVGGLPGARGLRGQRRLRRPGFNFLVFAGSEHAGTWGRAAVLPGDGALVGNSRKANSYPLLSGGFLGQVACSSAGNCAVAGNYQAKGLSRASAPLSASSGAAGGTKCSR